MRERAAGQRRGSAPGLLALMAAGLLLAATEPAMAQQRDTTRTREQVIRDRLRGLGPLIRPDTARPDTLAADTLGADTARADTVAVRRPAAERQPMGTLSGVERDSMMLRLLELEEYLATEYKADSARFVAESGQLDLRRSAGVLEGGQVLSADSSIVYYEQRALACAYGDPEVSGAGTTTPIVGDSLCYNTRSRVGFVSGARTTVSEGADWRIRGDFWVIDERSYGHDAIFTDCSLEEPHYHFAAKDMKVIRGNVIVARNVTMRFADVPVFWLPFFVQSLERGRASGLLFPQFSVNDVVRTSSGYQRRISDVGFYWAMNDYMGSEVALDWFSNNWTSLRGSFDYRILDKFLQGGLTFRRFWQTGGGTEFTLAGQSSWEPNERTRVNATANYTTSSEFIERNTFDPREINRTIASSGGVSRRFDWGTANLSATRTQYLSDNSVTMTLPSVGVNISSITLFEALPGDESWYSNATWTGSVNGNLQSRTFGNGGWIQRDSRDATGRVSSKFTLGRFSWDQNIDATQRVALGADSVREDLFMRSGDRTERRLQWSTSLDFQQRLIGSTTITPSLRMRSELVQGDTTGGRSVAAPLRLDFGANLRTDIFGFWPGFGPVERLRHKISPGISYSYSPAPTVTARQREVFGAGNVREQNQISLSLNQTIEARIRRSTEDSVRLDSIAEAEDTMSASGAPRRIQREQPLQILSLSTSALVYDFVEQNQRIERPPPYAPIYRNRGFQTTTITNSITSQLLPGLQVSLTHDLFRQDSLLSPIGGAPAEPRRVFDPELTQLNASFSLNSGSWIARTLGLGPRRDEAQAQRVSQQAAEDTLPGGEVGGPVPEPRRTDQLGLMGSSRRAGPMSRSPVGTWTASLNYTLYKPRAGEVASENQQITGSFNMQPTENWSLSWNTGYSLTRGEFTDHVLTLTRLLHDWDANFDFVKAQNGNLSFQFRVSLRANRDIKLDYEQRDRRLPGTGTF